jgi:hypothetical protein
MYRRRSGWGVKSTRSGDTGRVLKTTLDPRFREHIKPWLKASSLLLILWPTQ